MGECCQSHRDIIEELEAVCASKQAKIDELMLEYCPNEMTDEQIKEWEKHQKNVK